VAWLAGSRWPVAGGRWHGWPPVANGRRHGWPLAGGMAIAGSRWPVAWLAGSRWPVAGGRRPAAK